MSGKLVTCPFDPAHVIDPKKLLNHIEKCSKTSRNRADFVKCDYNFCHWVRKGTLKEHYETCKDRKVALDLTSAGWGSETGGFLPVVLVDNTKQPKKHEDSSTRKTTPSAAVEAPPPLLSIEAPPADSRKRKERDDETREGELSDNTLAKQARNEDSVASEEDNNSGGDGQAKRAQLKDVVVSVDNNPTTRIQAKPSGVATTQAPKPAVGRGRGFLLS